MLSPARRAACRAFNRLPANGLIVFSGTVLTEDGKEKRLVLDIAPMKPVSRSLYLCDNRFHTEELERMLEAHERYGFIVVDGNGALFATVCGHVKRILGGFSVSLPKKHGRGGQSKNRFARIRKERRHNYLRRVAEAATQHFISNDRPNVTAMILAGSAEFKTNLAASDLFDPRLKAVVVKCVDVAHGGEMGLNQAVELAADALNGVRLVDEKRVLRRFFDELARDDGGEPGTGYAYGAADATRCLVAGAVDTIIAFEDLVHRRYTITPTAAADDTEAVHVVLTPDEAARRGIVDGEHGAIRTTSEAYVEWIAQRAQSFGARVEFVSANSQEGAQFVRGFGGVAALLRYRVDVEELAQHEAEAHAASAGAASALATTKDRDDDGDASSDDGMRIYDGVMDDSDFD